MCPDSLLRKAWNTRPIEDALRAEIEKLRDRARWHKWPEEKPTEDGYYFIYDRVLGLDATYFYANSGDDMPSTFWMPAPELPGDDKNGQ